MSSYFDDNQYGGEDNKDTKDSDSSDSETTIKEYATYVFSIITFIDNYSICDNIFLKRLKKKYYKAEEILNLTLEEKIPEILCNDDEYRKKMSKTKLQNNI